MKIVIIGASGQLGTDVMNAFADQSPIGLDHRVCDIEQPTEIVAMLSRHKPDLVINTAAFHNVELCETEPERAFAVNALAVDRLAQHCDAAGVALAHVSTDYVFDGDTDRPYAENDMPNPLSVYGISKYAGELLIGNRCRRSFIFRTSGLYGLRGSSVKAYTFIERMLTGAAAGKPLRVVDDITCSPSYTRHVASAMRAVVETERYGRYHITNGGACTWYDFACEIFRQTGLSPDLAPTTKAEYPSVARRPRYSALANDAIRALGLPQLPPWQDGIRSYLAERSAGDERQT